MGLLIGGLARLGWAAEFMSRPIVTGFVFGLVILIVIGQIPSLLGMPSHVGKVQERAWFILTSLPEVNRTTAIIGLVSPAILFVGARFAPRIPWGLLVLVGSIVLSSGIDLAADGVVTVGPVPEGLPPIGLPGIAVSDLPSIAFGGLALAMVGPAEGPSAARLFAAREGVRSTRTRSCLRPGPPTSQPASPAEWEWQGRSRRPPPLADRAGRRRWPMSQRPSSP